ncbi:hypothetical protein [Aurantiacibacter sediminis]|uniref:CopG family transcriptional regulator n=1 Tax=Aurantiacibacter sediminis TaxID=2793064 RepID=A0ABS0N6K8_9SPHN|nr:hypothetical protein [Aurantiacibacter sediminis]MBH5323426.1 hypothetical protein [Aurantiacibacter sediminis]
MTSSAATETKEFASLGPMLLARKGTAKPAMRAQLTTSDRTAQLGDDFDTLADSQSDLGWNDMGDDNQVIDFPVVDNRPRIMPKAPSQPQRQSAVSQGKRAAFTLRLDAERHLKLKLASTMQNKSAQTLVTEALDRFLSEFIELDAIAAQVHGKTSKA